MISPQMILQQAFDEAVQHHMNGRLPQAENLYRKILTLEPNHAPALHFLGLLAHQAGRSDAAVELIWRAISLGLSTPDVLGNLGNALKGNGRIDDAIAAFRQSLLLRPIAPTCVNLGLALLAKGEPEQAVTAFERAIDLDPYLSEAYNNLAKALNDQARFEEAAVAARKAITLRPTYSDAFINLGNAYRLSGEYDLAIKAYSQGFAVAGPVVIPNPGLAKVHSSLGSAHNDLGQCDNALSAWREAMRLDPNDARHGDNLLLLLQYHPRYDSIAIADENDLWNRQHALPLAKLIQPHSNDKNPDRRLRIGYVSPDFKDHAVGRNMLPLFRAHDHSQFEIFCYSSQYSSDAIAKEFQRLADGFINIADLSDEQAAARIREDRIDILVDLALHTAHNRLLIFARKPAPVQVTFAGYPASTGLTAIDYRLSDPYLDPPADDDGLRAVYSEKTLRLTNSFWCYDPLDCGDIPVNSLPAASSGAVTFGCLNNFCKVNDQLLALWARVLGEVEHSRLLLLTRGGRPDPRTLAIMKQGGIAHERIAFAPTGPRREYLRTYHQIDIGLDSFPYNGHTTSLDSLWMGVPVVTLVGDRSVARAGWSQLSNLDMTELAAFTPDRFVQIAVNLANDLPRLCRIRSTLRSRMERSPLMDASLFAQNIEKNYRLMWRTWCSQIKSEIE